ncbi:MAG: hypothetical protein EOO56_01765 [Hymenobacter sp.]|nr:MAG: hypothetical protein EOO56_01765 [Hymenobacter sp.]
MISYFTTCLLAASALLLPLAAQAQVHVLFVGNSFTHGKIDSVRLYNAANVTDENYGQTGARAESGYTGPWGGIPGIFKKMTDQAGLSYDVHIESISGQPLETHYNNALSVIKQPTWDKVVLQDQSTYPIPPKRNGNRASFYSNATKLEQAVHQANAQAQVYLYETWGRADLTYPNNQVYSGLPIDTMAQDLHNSYYAQYAANGRYAGVAPAGDAWIQAISSGVAMRNPYTPDKSKLNLWWTGDNYHPSKWGSYLNACVLFYTLTGIDPRTLGSAEQAAADLAIRPSAAVALQRVAYQQLSPSPLPVQLVDFTVHATSASAVALSWLTASELNSASFVAERSVDGVSFVALGHLASAGSSATPHRYTYIDAGVPAGACYYRLRLVDQDGSATYSPVRTVPPRASQLLLYPNPAPGGATRLAGAFPGTVVRVLDSLGRVVLTTTADPTGTAALASLRRGLYEVRAGSSTVRLSVE